MRYLKLDDGPGSSKSMLHPAISSHQLALAAFPQAPPAGVLVPARSGRVRRERMRPGDLTPGPSVTYPRLLRIVQPRTTGPPKVRKRHLAVGLVQSPVSVTS